MSPFIHMTASSDNLYKNPQLQPQEPPMTPNPALTSPASHHYHKGTDKFSKSQRNKTKSSAKIQEHSKIMYGFSISSNTVPWTMFSSADYRLPEWQAKIQEQKTHLKRWLLKIIQILREIFWLIYFIWRASR